MAIEYAVSCYLKRRRPTLASFLDRVVLSIVRSSAFLGMGSARKGWKGLGSGLQVTVSG